ncbi:GNAT family N-acetyltransferase [Neisseria animaloris]|uniref:GNAT family N-acetyltransferase n=1 Tax=Neisseria animaloris TaxID=326522 RepID=UPI000A19A13C|nr:GNAT family N-acetyltransferase [Neisseria animaloris]
MPIPPLKKRKQHLNPKGRLKINIQTAFDIYPPIVYRSINMQWHSKTFPQLTNLELYRILQLRSRIFVVEQNCAFLDSDGLDLEAVHIYYGNENTVAAYARILKTPDHPIAPAAIGRLAVAAEYRRQGLAAETLQRGMNYIQTVWQYRTIYLQAQTYLLPFYRCFGYETVSEEYSEDGIPHIDMRFTR